MEQSQPMRGHPINTMPQNLETGSDHLGGGLSVPGPRACRWSEHEPTLPDPKWPTLQRLYINWTRTKRLFVFIQQDIQGQHTPAEKEVNVLLTWDNASPWLYRDIHFSPFSAQVPTIWEAAKRETVFICAVAATKRNSTGCKYFLTYSFTYKVDISFLSIYHIYKHVEYTQDNTRTGPRAPFPKYFVVFSRCMAKGSFMNSCAEVKLEWLMQKVWL